MIEFEKKLLLSKKEYETLMKRTVPDATVVQRNYYYDSDDLKMNRADITCRIREKNGSYVATMKNHSPLSNTENSAIAYSPWDSRFFNDPTLKLQGCMTTTRTLLYRNDFLEIVLDKNDYLDCTDYELEIEYTSEKEWQAEHCLREIRKYLQSRCVHHLFRFGCYPQQIRKIFLCFTAKSFYSALTIGHILCIENICLKFLLTTRVRRYIMLLPEQKFQLVEVL